ncbi:MAG: hypothetical protein HQ568_07525 [Calditrichaeota bacterium]|nr:hypothetical protein [Calditrichota bacterium]
MITIEKKYSGHLHIFIATVLMLYIAVVLMAGCAANMENRYMIDDPVNDPIMSCDDQQDSDLVKVEEGGGGSAGGGCPT